MKKIAIVMLLSVLFLATGCSSGKKDAKETSASSENVSEKASESEWPRTYHDGLGNDVEIKAEPKRVVVLHYGYTEYLLELGITPVGSTALASAKTFKTLAPYAQELESITDVGDVKSPDLEKILALEPDLIIASPGIHDEAAEKLNKIATTVFKKPYGTWKETLLDYAAMTGKEKAAEDFEAEMTEIIADSQKQLEPVAGKTFAFLRPAANNSFNLMGTVTDSIFYDKALGLGLTQPEGLPEKWEAITMETLLKMAPDYIVFQDDLEKCQAQVKELNETSDLWKSISAVKENHVYYLDVSVNTGSPLALKLAAEDLVKLLNEDK